MGISDTRPPRYPGASKHPYRPGPATAPRAARCGQSLCPPRIRQAPAPRASVACAISRGTYLLKHLKNIASGRSVALCDLHQDALDHGVETIGGNPATYKDYRDLLARKDIDAVFAITPLFVRFPLTRDVLLAGKHVFCEKCLVFKPDEVHALRALAHYACQLPDGRRSWT